MHIYMKYPFVFCIQLIDIVGNYVKARSQVFFNNDSTSSKQLPSNYSALHSVCVSNSSYYITEKSVKKEGKWLKNSYTSPKGVNWISKGKEVASRLASIFSNV